MKLFLLLKSSTALRRPASLYCISNGKLDIGSLVLLVDAVILWRSRVLNTLIEARIPPSTRQKKSNCLLCVMLLVNWEITTPNCHNIFVLSRENSCNKMSRCTFVQTLTSVITNRDNLCEDL